MILFLIQEKVDKLVSTFEEDPEYKAFLIKLAQPEIVSDVSIYFNLLQQVNLLIYLIYFM